jgi:hypothetical protein
MRRLTFTFLLFTAATLTTQAQLTNGDLETWTYAQWSTPPTGSGNSYDEPGSGTNRTTHFLRSLNALNDLGSGLAIPVSCFKTDTAHGGSYAARIRSQQYLSYFIPGFLGTGDINIASQTLNLGRPYTAHPDSFSTWYKYAGVGGDSARFEVIFTLYDALNQVSVPIGYGRADVKTNTSTWTKLKFGIQWDTVAAPDTAIIIAASSGGYNLSNFLSSTGDPGSQLWIDDMTLWSGFVGIDDCLDVHLPELLVYPNPTTDQLYLGLGYCEGTPFNWTIKDIRGAEISNGNSDGLQTMIDVSTLAYGTYIVQLQFAEKTIVRKFIK